MRKIEKFPEFEKEINVYDVPFKPDVDPEFAIVSTLDINALNDEQRKVVLDSLLEADRKEFPEGVYIPTWREFVLRQNAKSQDNPKFLTFELSSSYRAQQLREMSFADAEKTGEMFNSIEGVILTADERVMYAIRGGNVASGRMHVTPTGSIVPPKSGHPVFESFYSELLEELGIEREQVYNVRWIGDQTDPHMSKGRHFILAAETRLTSEVLCELHDAAFRIYSEAKVANVPEMEARALIGQRGFKNIDAWEHLKFTPLTPTQVTEGVTTGKITYDGRSYELLNTGKGILVAYDTHRKL